MQRKLAGRVASRPSQEVSKSHLQAKDECLSIVTIECALYMIGITGLVVPVFMGVMSIML